MFKVEAPKVLLPARGGLLAAANVITDDADRVAHFGPEYEGVPCGQLREIPEPGTDKVFDEKPLVRGVLFGIYRGLEEPLLVSESSDTQTLRDLFEGGESFAAERAVQRLLLNPDAVDLTPTPGTPVTNLKAAMGILEQYAGEVYGGVPLLHANRYITALMPELQVDDSDWTIHTQQGTPFANGAGYSDRGPDGLTAPEGAGWLYISGQVNLWQGTPQVTEAHDLKRNKNQALIEAVYAATVECFTAAILVGI